MQIEHLTNAKGVAAAQRGQNVIHQRIATWLAVAFAYCHPPDTAAEGGALGIGMYMKFSIVLVLNAEYWRLAER